MTVVARMTMNLGGFRSILPWILLSCGLLCGQAGWAQELITDTHLQRGVNAKGTVPTVTVIGPLQFTTANGTPIWGLAEWWSQQTIYGTTPSVLPSGAYQWSNAYKRATLGPTGTGDSDVILYVDSIAEYGGVFRTSGQNWPHLLVEQKISSPGGGAASYAPWIADMDALLFNVEARLNSAYNYYGSGYNSNLHAAEFVIYFTVQYLKTGQTGYGDYLWFGLKLYDDRHAKPGLYQNWDGGTSKYIYNIGLPFTDTGMAVGTWKTVSGDLLPYIVSAFNAARSAGALPYSGNLADYKIGGMNMGWEVPGLSRVEMQVRNFSLVAVQPDKSLVVSSPHGSADPDGSNTYPHGTNITASVAGSPEVGGGTRYACHGWAGTGSVPASGATTNTGSFSLTADSTLEWLWATNYWLSATPSSGGSVGSVVETNFYADFSGSSAGSVAEANLNAGTPVGYWTGNNVEESTVADNAIGRMAAFESGRYTNIAMMASGVALSNGVSLRFDARIKSLTSNGLNRILVKNESGQNILEIQYNAVSGGHAVLRAYHNNGATTGWTVISDDMLTASDTCGDGLMDEMEFVFSEDSWSAIVNGVALVSDALYSSAAGNRIGRSVGQIHFVGLSNASSIWLDNIVVAPASKGWKAKDATVQLVAKADAYYHFAGWSGDTAGDTNSTQMTLTLDQARSVVANFAPNLTSTGTPEWWLAQHGFTDFEADAVSDTDGDGLLAWQEYVAGTNPTNPASAFRIAIGEATPGGDVIRWPSVADRFYSVGWTTNLFVPFTVWPDAANLPATPPENSYTNPVPAGGSMFYRINVSMSPVPVAVLREDFEDDTVGLNPAIGGMNIGDPYGNFFNEATVQANPEANGNTSAKVLRGGGVATDYGRAKCMFAGGVQLIDGMTVAYDFYSSQVGLNVNDGLRVSFLSSTDTLDCYLRNDPTGLIKLDGNDQVETNYGPGVWQHFTATFTQTAANTYDLAWSITNMETSASVGGTQSVVFASAFAGEAAGVQFEFVDVDNTADDYYAYADNITVTVAP